MICDTCARPLPDDSPASVCVFCWRAELGASACDTPDCPGYVLLGAIPHICQDCYAPVAWRYEDVPAYAQSPHAEYLL